MLAREEVINETVPSPAKRFLQISIRIYGDKAEEIFQGVLKPKKKKKKTLNRLNFVHVLKENCFSRK